MMQRTIFSRLKSMKDELKITSDQEKLWKTFVDALYKNEKEKQRIEAEASHRNLSQSEKAALTKEAQKLTYVLGMMEKMIRERLEGLQQIKAALDPLYASFNEKQKEIADRRMFQEIGSSL
ncbi:MAG: Spy/CpxP family protein refolding chaperone [Alphaproteobacteria bacterium]|nr:Spy/CpxP family protein refolding chaperone [Alphaproteobacteria bacterium]